MKSAKDIFFSPKVTLTRRDLIDFEPVLKQSFAAFLDFDAYSLYFPQSLDHVETEDGEEKLTPGRALFLPEEGKALVPMVLPTDAGDELLGVFVARGVKVRAPKQMAELMPRMATLCLEKLLLYKMGITDPLTALANGKLLLDTLAGEIRTVRDCLRPASTQSAPGATDLPEPCYRARLAVAVVRIDNLERINRAHGFPLGDKLITRAAEAIAPLLPPQAVAGRKDDCFVVCLPDGSPSQARKLTEQALADVGAVRLADPLTEERVRPLVSAGYAAYPRDMEGRLFEKPSSEQARMLLRKAKKAASVCAEHGASSPFGFSRILGEGGSVVQELPGERLAVNLGREVDAREGQRFLAWSPDSGTNGGTNGDRSSPSYKGEIILMEVGETRSVAEIIHHADPAWTIEPGDRLTLLSEQRTQADPASRDADGADEASDAKRDPLTGLRTYRGFLRRWTRLREECDQFAMVLVRLEGDVAEADDYHAHAGQRAAEAADLAAKIFGENALGGRHGLSSLVYFLPGEDAPSGLPKLQELHRRIGEELGIEAVIGGYCHPFLDYRMADAPDNVRKALEYASLLPPPRVGLFDSLAVTISADRLFSRGDLYGAIEEYKTALLADDGNNLARNSLGICQARLGRMLEARTLFEEAVARDAADVMAYYNLGFACQKLGEIEEAEAAYLKCLEHQPDHLYVHIRLGRLAERDGDLELARARYEQAAKLEGGEGITRRYLARLALIGGDAERARELLHQALIFDPRDAASLHMMAKIYLDAGDDPEVAEAFARQSAALSPGNKIFWLELARACEAGGKDGEASDAVAKAMAL